MNKTSNSSLMITPSNDFLFMLTMTDSKKSSQTMSYFVTYLMLFHRTIVWFNETKLSHN